VIELHGYFERLVARRRAAPADDLVQVGLLALLARCPRLSLRDAAPKWLDSLVFRGMRSLPVALG